MKRFALAAGLVLLTAAACSSSTLEGADASTDAAGSDASSTGGDPNCETQDGCPLYECRCENLGSATLPSTAQQGGCRTPKAVCDLLCVTTNKSKTLEPIACRMKGGVDAGDAAVPGAKPGQACKPSGARDACVVSRCECRDGSSVARAGLPCPSTGICPSVQLICDQACGSKFWSGKYDE